MKRNKPMKRKFFGKAGKAGNASKPCPHKHAVAGIQYFPDGREVCNLRTPAGKAEYRRRTLAMLERQKGLCCLCGKHLEPSMASFEHRWGRGGGRRDDSEAINGASHLLCNMERGSKKTPFLL